MSKTYLENDASYAKKLAEIKRVCRSYKKWNKCFGIGFNKTGTSSLNAVMTEILGFLSNQTRIEINSTVQAISGNYLPLQKEISLVDFHQDLPASQGNTYVALDALFPNSKFILTVREAEEWFRSFIHQYRIPLLDLATDSIRIQQAHIYKGYSHRWIGHFMEDQINVLKKSIKAHNLQSLDDYKKFEFTDEFKDSCIQLYKLRNREIRKYFKERDDMLLILDITKEQTVENIRDFLGIPDIFNASMPHLNSANNSNNDIIRHLKIN